MTDLRTDLLADLQHAASARTLPRDPSPAPPVAAAPPAATPLLALELTPLKWALPSVAAAGVGLRLRVGPVGLSVRLG